MQVKQWNQTFLQNYKPSIFSRNDIIIALSLFVFSLIFYTSKMTPSVSAGDNGELTTAVYFLGIAHAPGYPLHSFMGKLFTFLPINNVGWRTNFFSVFCGALTIYFSVLVYIKMLKSAKLPELPTQVAAVVAGLAFMYSETLWSQAIMAEVYTMSAVFYPVLLIILLKWHDSVVEHAEDEHPYFGEKYLLAFSFLFGVAMAGHQTILVTGGFAFIFIVYTLVTQVVLPRKLTERQIGIGSLLLGILVISLAIAFYLFYKNIMKLGTNMYDPDVIKAGMLPFIIINMALLGSYLFMRHIMKDSIDADNTLQKAYFTVIKMFWIFYIGYFMNFYMFIRAHGEPPINWMGINEASDWWVKLGKFWNAVWRKQYGDMGKVPLNTHNVLLEFKLLITKIHGSQFTIPMYLVAGIGAVYSFFRQKLAFFSLLTMFVSYNIAMTFFLRFKFDDRSLFFINVFYIFSYFVISIWIAWGAIAIYQFINGLSGKKTDPDQKESVES